MSECIKQTNDLQKHLDNLSLEANFIGNVFLPFINSLKGIYPSVKASFSTVSNLPSERKHVVNKIDLRSEYNTLSKLIPNATFLNYSKTLVTIPEGLTVKPEILVNFLIKHNSELYEEINTMLTEYSSFLSVFISDKNAKRSNQEIYKVIARSERRRKELTQELGSMFDGSHTSKAYLTAVIDRFSDLDQLVRAGEKLESIRCNSDTSHIKESANKVSSLLDIILDDNNSESMRDISGEAAQSIVYGAQELAKAIEFMGVYHYKNEVAVMGVKNILTDMIRILK